MNNKTQEHITQEMDEILTVKDVCIWLKITLNQLYHLTSGRRIPCFKIGKSLRFRKVDIRDWIDQQIEYNEGDYNGRL